MTRFLACKSKEGGYYRVTCDPRGGRNRWTCQCKGYTYRRQCRHIEAAKQALRAGIVGIEVI